MNKLKATLAASALAGLAGAASAQSSVTLYGVLDQYLNYMRSSSGTHIRGLEDGAFLRSRLGFKGTEDLGNGLQAKFQLEMGLTAPTGQAADTTRSFDRQAWAGLNTPVGEFRLGRQNTAVFYRGDYIDWTSRTLGSMINNFGVPSRYDNDVSWISPRWAGFLAEAHYALAEQPANNGLRSQAVYQAALDYLNGPFRVGYAGVHANAPANASIKTQAKYDNVYANYDFGKGKIYLAFIRTNNSTSTANGNNAGAVLGNVGALLAGTNTDINRYYNISQISADYRVLPNLRLGAIYGRIRDTSGSGRDANGGVLGGYYDLSKRTMLYGLVDRLANGANAGFRPVGSAGLPYNFTNPNDVNGRTIDGVQFGITHRF